MLYLACTFIQNRYPKIDRDLSMKEFEYLTMAIEATGWRGGKIDLGVLNNRLNELGREGWELVAMEDTNITQGATRDVILILKRERISSTG